MRKVSQWLAIGLVTAMTGTAMAGATVDVLKIKDKSLIADFDDNEAVTCANGSGAYTNSAIHIQWNTSLIKADGTTTLQSAIVADLHYIDGCTGDDLVLSGFALNTNGSVSTDLANGHVDAVIPVMTDPDPDTGAFQSGTLTINFNFTATGAAETIRDRSHSRDGGIVFLNNFLVSRRPGVASGTATGTLPFAAGARTVDMLHGQQSFAAQIGKDGFGSMTIITKAHQ